jgi:hypothetical protein
METEDSSEILVTTYQTIQHHIPEDSCSLNHQIENLESPTKLFKSMHLNYI